MDEIQWITSDNAGENTFTDFGSFHTESLSNYSENELAYILPLLKGEILLRGHEAVVEEEEEETNDDQQEELVHAELLASLKENSSSSSESDNDSSSDSESIMVQMRDRTVMDTSYIDAVLQMTGINALVRGDETVFGSSFSHAIRNWYTTDSFLEDIESVPCSSEHMETVIFVQFILTWFGGFIAGGYASLVLGIKDDVNTEFDLFIPVLLTCRLYSVCIHSLNNENVRVIVQAVRTIFIGCIKNWLKRYSHKHSHKTINEMENIFEILGVFASGVLKFYPRAVANIIFPNVLKLFANCTRGLHRFMKRKLLASATAIHLGFYRITESGLTDLHVILHFQPDMKDYSNVGRAPWTAFNLLSNFHINYARSLIGEFKTLGNDSVSVGRMHTLFHPNWRTYSMLRLLEEYLSSIYHTPVPSTSYLPFTFSAKHQRKRIKQTCRMISKYISEKGPFSGFPVDHLLIRRVPKLVTICLSTLVTNRDLDLYYFQSHFRSAGTLINAGIHYALTETIAQLDGDIGQKLSTCKYSHASGFTFEK